MNKDKILREADFYGHLTTVRVLIATGADVKAKNKEDKTPLDLFTVRVTPTMDKALAREAKQSGIHNKSALIRMVLQNWLCS